MKQVPVTVRLADRGGALLRLVNGKQHMNMVRHDYMTFEPYRVTFFRKQKLFFANLADG